MKAQYTQIEEKMKKTIYSLDHELTSIRAGRANPAVLEKIVVDYYGTMTPIQQMAAVSVPEARTLVIQPWDASSLKGIEKAIQASDLGLNPNNDGKVIRLNFPPLTEERRRDLNKSVHKTGEDSKVAIRNIRRDAMDMFKEIKKKGDITEDDVKTAEKEIQGYTDKYCKEIDTLVTTKEKEIMEV